MIKFIRKLIGVGCLFAGFLHGQNTGENVVSVTTINNVIYTASSTVVTVGPLQNIGQTSHIVKAIFSNIVVGGSFTGVIQGSSDCSNYVNIGPLTSSTNGITSTNNVMTLIGYGAFPCVRVRQEIDVSSMGSLTIFEEYIGTSTPVFVTSDELGVINELSYSFSKTLVYGTPTIVAGVTGGGFGARIVVYGIELSMPSTFTEFVLYCSSDGTAQTLTVADIVNSSSEQVIWPLGLRPYRVCPIGLNLYYAATGSGVSSYNVQYRNE